MLIFQRILFAVKIIAIVSALGGKGFSGTPKQKAAARVAVAAAQIEIAANKAKLEDQLTRTAAARASLETELATVREDKDAALRTAAEAHAKAVEQNERLSAELNDLKAAADEQAKQIESFKSDYVPRPPTRIVMPESEPMQMTLNRSGMISEIMPAQLRIGGWEKGCDPCKRLEADIFTVLAPYHWKIGNADNDQIQFYHVPNTEAAPQLELFQNGISINKWTGYQDPSMLSHELEKAWRSAGEHPNASAMAYGSAGTIKAANHIRKAIEAFRTYIGEGNSTSGLWESNHAGHLSLFAMGNWDDPSVFGTNGRIQVDFPSAINMPVKGFAFKYRLVGRDVLFDAEEVTFIGLLDKIGLHHSQAAEAGPYGLFVLDDVLLVSSVFSLIKNIFALLQPSCDLMLPPQVAANAVLNGDMLRVEFTQAPQIRLVWLFTFNLTVKTVEITEHSVRVVFSGSRLIKERTFDVR